MGRLLPTDANPTPKLYRMRIFAPNHVVAKSRFWYFLSKLRKVKKANGEIVSINTVCLVALVGEEQQLTTAKRSTRSAPRRSRTSASGSATTRAPAPTTCTRSTARCRDATPSTPSTRTWPRGTAPVSERSTCVASCLLRVDARPLTRSAQILKVVEVEKTADLRRPYLQQLVKPGLKFPLPHRVPKATASKVFSHKRPSTFV